jgi:hypothetical protein
VKDFYDSIYIQVPCYVENALLGLRYFSVNSQIGLDSFSYRIYADSVPSADAGVQINVQAWDDPPLLIPLTTKNIVERKEIVIELGATDTTSKTYLGVYIMSLPAKGKLYQYLENGVKGEEIDQAYSAYRQIAPIYNYASEVMNVSSFWGSGPYYSPLMLFGEQEIFTYGGSQLTWTPLTADGYGGPVSGGGADGGITFKSDPETMFTNFGYTEYIELRFKKNVYVSELLIGENRGMGSIKNILAKDPNGNWMIIYTTVVTGAVQLLFDKFKRYRKFRPQLCGTPFLTQDIRFEIDTRTVPDWQEWDFFELGGTETYDRSAVTFNGNAVWKVIYVPDPTSSGVDTFTYSATDCPATNKNWAINPGEVYFSMSFFMYICICIFIYDKYTYYHAFLGGLYRNAHVEHILPLVVI